MKPRSDTNTDATLITCFKDPSALAGPTTSRTAASTFRKKGPHPYYVRSPQKSKERKDRHPCGKPGKAHEHVIHIKEGTIKNQRRRKENRALSLINK